MTTTTKHVDVHANSADRGFDLIEKDEGIYVFRAFDRNAAWGVIATVSFLVGWIISGLHYIFTDNYDSLCEKLAKKRVQAFNGKATLETAQSMEGTLAKLARRIDKLTRPSVDTDTDNTSAVVAAVVEKYQEAVSDQLFKTGQLAYVKPANSEMIIDEDEIMPLTAESSRMISDQTSDFRNNLNRAIAAVREDRAYVSSDESQEPDELGDDDELFQEEPSQL